MQKKLTSNINIRRSVCQLVPFLCPLRSRKRHDSPVKTENMWHKIKMVIALLMSTISQ